MVFKTSAASCSSRTSPSSSGPPVGSPWESPSCRSLQGVDLLVLVVGLLLVQPVGVAPFGATRTGLLLLDANLGHLKFRFMLPDPVLDVLRQDAPPRVVEERRDLLL